MVRVALVASLLLMLSAEFLNTAVEKLCDHLHPDRHPSIGTVKDLASAGAFLRRRRPCWSGWRRWWNGWVEASAPRLVGQKA